MSEIIIVTGASSGIGRALTLDLAKSGEQVLAIARRAELLQELKAIYPHHIKTVPADVSTEIGRSYVKSLLPNGTKIKALINNAAMMAPVGLLENIDVGEWRKQIAINLEAPLFLTNHLLPYLEGGRILNVTIYSSFNVTPGLGAYALSKAALNMLTEYFKVELHKYNIAVASVLPGVVDTDIQKQQEQLQTPDMLRFKHLKEDGKFLKPETVAQFLKWLLLNTEVREFSKKVWNIYDQDHHSYWANGLNIIKPF